MVIDYIYIILIILIILFIIYIIYLSYDYNFNENNKEYFFVNNNTNEIDLDLVNTNEIDLDLVQINDYIDNYKQNFNKINIEIDNNIIQNSQTKNLEILNKSNINLNNIDKLKIIKTEQLIKKNELPIDKPIKTIKSKYNAQYLSTFTYDNENYNILANDKCLTTRGLCKDEFCLLNCQTNLYSSNSQKFKPYKIINESDAADIMNVSIENIISNQVYPYTIFKSLVNDNCLTISNEGISIEPCNLNNIKQQWEISPDENLCVLE